MDRRDFVRAGTGVGVGLLAGCAAADPNDINVEEPKPLEDGEFDFDEETSVAWLNERLMENPTQENPIFGRTYSFETMVLFNGIRESQILQLVDWVGWRIVNGVSEGFNVDRALPFLSPVFERLEDASGEFYESTALIHLAGVQEPDQQYYEKYQNVPQIVGLLDPQVDRNETQLPAGTVVRVSGTLDWIEEGEVHPFQGPYFNVEEVQPVDRVTSTLDIDTEPGDRASFVGLQWTTGPTLTNTRTTHASYEQAENLPYPIGGSLIWVEGTVTDLETDFGRVRTASMDVDQQSVIVGDVSHERPWQNDDQSTPDDSAELDTEDSPVNTVCVMDVSGSMSEDDTRSGRTRLQVAQDSAETLVNFITDENRFGLVTFSSTARTHASLQDIGDSRQTFLETIGSLQASGNTSIGGGLREAYEQLRNAEGPKSIVLLSDGQENAAPYVSEVLPDVNQLGITVYTIGMGDEVDVDLLERIASLTGGESEYAPDPDEVQSFYHRFSVSAQDRSRLKMDRAELTEGDSTSGTATVDQTNQDVQFSLSYPGSEIKMDVTAPDGTQLSSTMDQVSHRGWETSEVWLVDDPQTGEWSYDIVAEQLDGRQEATIEVNGNSPVDASLSVSDDLYIHTGFYKVELLATVGERRYTDADVTFIAEQGDIIEEIQLHDRGFDADPVDDDGIYTGYFHPPETGEYELSARISGGIYEDVEREFRETITVEETVEEPIQFYDSGDSPWGISRIAAALGSATLFLAVFWGTLRALAGDEDGP